MYLVRHLTVTVPGKNHAECLDQERDFVLEEDDLGTFIGLLFFCGVSARYAQIVFVVACLFDIEVVAALVIPESFIVKDVIEF